ncbi:MAG: hypothetical protein WA958_04215, partial [Tunicatimonas sp.]
MLLLLIHLLNPRRPVYFGLATFRHSLITDLSLAKDLDKWFLLLTHLILFASFVVLQKQLWPFSGAILLS